MHAESLAAGQLRRHPEGLMSCAVLIAQAEDVWSCLDSILCQLLRDLAWEV